LDGRLVNGVGGHGRCQLAVSASYLVIGGDGDWWELRGQEIASAGGRWHRGNHGGVASDGKSFAVLESTELRSGDGW